MYMLRDTLFRGIAMDLDLLDWLNTYTFRKKSNYEG